MSKNLQESKDFEVSNLDFTKQNEEDCFPHRFFSHYNKKSSFEETTEIIWSLEKKIYCENIFNANESDGFSDFSGRSASSSSWNNDEFDMLSSSKVSQSLEAVDNALFEKHQSPFISQEVFKECCEWSNKFPYFRLKGEKIIKPDDVFLNCDKNENETSKSYESCVNFQVEGKKMALHQPDKTSRKINFKFIQDSEQATCSEKIGMGNDDKIFSLSQCENTYLDTVHSNLLKQDDKTSATSLNFFHEKIIEKLILNTWPKVLEVLQQCQNAPKAENIYEDFKLPPIVTTQREQKQYISLQRPRTEGTSSSVVDFPKLSSALSVSPKILQDRTDCKSGKRSLRSSRPTSEIYLSRRKNMFSNISSKISSQKLIYPLPDTSKQMQLTSKTNKGEKDEDTISLFLPALEEDITDPIGYLKGISLQTESKTIPQPNITQFPKKTECFLPPISMNKLHPTIKLTRNLFTFFGSDLKTTNNKGMSYNPKTPALHSNISSSKKGMKQQEESSYKLLNENFSSLSSSNHLETQKADDNLDTQVTLFPIVKSLTPSKEKKSSSAKRSFPNASSCQKR